MSMNDVDVDIDALVRGRRSRRMWIIPLVLAAAIGAGVAAFLLLRTEEPEPVPEPQRAEAVSGRLSTTVDLSGAAAAERSADLTFDASGTVASVSVGVGDAVAAGDVLATLDDYDAQLRVETAEVQLRLAQLRLDDLLADPGAAEIAAAELSVASARAQLASSELSLARLIEPAGAAEIAGAEQAVSSALGQLSSAEEALSRLSEPASAAEIASAEQALSSALGQLSSAEEALAALVEEPTETEIEAARSSVTQSQASLSAALTRADESLTALRDAVDRYCELFGYIRGVGEETCGADLPLSDGQVAVLRDSLDGRSSAYERYATELIGANVAVVTDDAARLSAMAALSTARERLGELLKPASEEDVRQAELAVEAARASHEAAEARLAELVDEPAERDVYQAQRAVEAARASQEAAEARLADLRAPADEDEVAQARAALESATASLESAAARYDELLAGATANAISQQRENVRLAEISLALALADLDELVIVAPFAGTVEAVGVRDGDRVTANLAAVSLVTTDRMLIELTVTEADLPGLSVGQAGLATFDALEGAPHPVRIASISRVPDSAQGVVTYDVDARILAGPEIAEVAEQLAVLGGMEAPGGFGAGALPGLGDLGGAAGLPPGFELPEGMTVREVLEAVASGGPMPEGLTLPEGLDISPQEMRRLAGLLLGGLGGRGGDGPQALAAARPRPAPGMSASVEILTEVREPSVLVPVAAVRQIDGGWFVAVPAPAAGGEGPGFERVAVEIGESDGVNVEIASGLDEGAVVLIGADAEGIAFTATQLQPAASGLDLGRGLGPGLGGGGPR